jgi:hypothetical protein
VSCPEKRIGEPSSSIEPNAIDSASAQSTSPSSNIFVRASNCRSSLGCTTNPSGGVDITV